MRWGATARIAAAIAIASLALASASSAAAEQGAAPSPAAAQAALEAATEALAPDPGPPDRGATIALAELAAALPALEGADRRRARAMLARPTDGASDPFGDGYTVPARSTDSEHFRVHYVTSTADAADPDYAAEIAAIAELARAKQVDELGWPPPKPDRDRGGDSRTDIYLKELGRWGHYGYAAPDPGQGRARRQHGYVVIDNDYLPSEFPGFAEPLDAARVTVAHELNHLLHDAISTRQDPWMFEATATWVEEKVFPGIDDYLRYVKRFARSPDSPITSFSAGGGLKVYGTAVWNHWLEGGAGGYGPDVVRRAWEVSGLTRPRDFAIGAYHRAIRGAGGSGIGSELVDFAAATAEWRTGAGGFPDAERYPNMRRQGRLAPGRLRAFRLHHTAYRLLRVPRVRAPRIRLVLRAPRGVTAGVALVTRRGGPVRGRAVRRVKYMPRGGRRVIALRSPRRFSRITAVAINADGRLLGGDAYNRRYLKDHQLYRARLVARR